VTILDYAAPDLLIDAVMEAISRAWWRVVAQVECLGGTWRHMRSLSSMDLPRIIRSIPCSPDFRIILSKWGCDEGVKETDNNFKGMKRCVDDWNYETVIEDVKDAWKRQ